MNRLLLSALAASSFLAGGAVIATAADMPPPPPARGHDIFAAMDSNKNGIVTRAEVKALLDKRFAELDADHNGVVTAAERHAERERVRTARFNARFDAMDTDKNGQLSREELRAAFERRDEDGPGGARPGGMGPDGAAPPPPPPGAEVGPQGMPGPGGPEGHGFGHGGFGGGFGRWGGGDRDADMSKDQFEARPLRLFDVIDSNHDGKITPAERDAAMALSHPWRNEGPRSDAPPPRN